MQRAERIALVSIGLLIASFFAVSTDHREYGPHVMGVALSTVALASAATAVHRWVQGYRILRAREEPARDVPAREAPRRTVPISSKHRPAA
jgi:hypothetical protein